MVANLQLPIRPSSSSFSNDTRSYEKVDRTAHEIKADVERHLEEKELIELGIPSSIVIGPFHVLTENVRQALSKKRKALANALLELLARILRSKVDSVSRHRRFCCCPLSLCRFVRSSIFRCDNAPLYPVVSVSRFGAPIGVLGLVY